VEEEEFVIYGDASRQGIRCVLMQDGQIIAYVSSQLKPYDKNYTHALELAAGVRIKNLEALPLR